MTEDMTEDMTEETTDDAPEGRRQAWSADSTPKIRIAGMLGGTGPVGPIYGETSSF